MYSCFHFDRVCIIAFASIVKCTEILLILFSCFLDLLRKAV